MRWHSPRPGHSEPGWVEGLSARPESLPNRRNERHERVQKGMRFYPAGHFPSPGWTGVRRPGLFDPGCFRESARALLGRPLKRHLSFFRSGRRSVVTIDSQSGGDLKRRGLRPPPSGRTVRSLVSQSRRFQNGASCDWPRLPLPRRRRSGVRDAYLNLPCVFDTSPLDCLSRGSGVNANQGFPPVLDQVVVLSSG
jgi:hypothetical protein